MRIAVYMEDGRYRHVNILDRISKTEPFMKDLKAGVPLATKIDLRPEQFNDLEKHGLVAVVFWHDANEEAGTNEGPAPRADFSATVGQDIEGNPILLEGDVAVARQRIGRLITVLTPHEAKSAVKIEVNGELMAFKQGGHWINALQFHMQEILYYSSAATASVNSRAVTLFSNLQKIHPEKTKKEIAALLGYPLIAIEAAEEAEQATNTIEDDDVASENNEDYEDSPY